MKKQVIHLLTAVMLVAAPASLITGCSVMHHQETAGEYGQDAKVTAKIKADLYKDPDVKGTEVHVTTMNGVVQLSGFVDTQAAKDRAEQLARAVPGVTEVHNNLLLPTGR